MRVKRCEESFPAVWRTAYKGCEKAVYEGDIKIRTLRMKLLVFKTKKDMREFWHNAEPTKYTGKLGDCVGVVSSLCCEVEGFADADDEFDPKPHMEVDGRYFAVMALLVGHLGMEVITHESVHAAFAYAKRLRTRSPWTPVLDDLDEEAVCYPAGRIARLVVQSLNNGGMYGNGHLSLDPA